MKNLFLLLLILTLGFSTYAQIENPVVFSLTGKARLQTPEAKKAMKLQTGDQLAPNGSLILKKGMEVGLIFDEQFIYLQEPGTYQVETLMAPGEMDESEATELFYVKLEPALDPYFGRVKLQRAGFANNTTTTQSKLPPKKKSREGHGNKDNALIRLMPTGGKVVGPNVKFGWTTQTDITSKIKNFNLVLIGPDDQVLLKQAVKGNEAEVNLAQLNLETGSSFKWRVEAADDASKNTGDVTVMFAPANAEKAAMDLLREDQAYQMASPAAKMLMEAVAYENAGLLAKADETYKTIRKKFKKDRLGRLMYYAFLWDNDLVK